MQIVFSVGVFDDAVTSMGNQCGLSVDSNCLNIALTLHTSWNDAVLPRAALLLYQPYSSHHSIVPRLMDVRVSPHLQTRTGPRNAVTRLGQECVVWIKTVFTYVCKAFNMTHTGQPTHFGSEHICSLLPLSVTV